MWLGAKVISETLILVLSTLNGHAYALLLVVKESVHTDAYAKFMKQYIKSLKKLDMYSKKCEKNDS
jgi:hypothetical protein